MKNNPICRTLAYAALPLMIPLIGTQVSNEWDWGVLDFVVVYFLLAGTGFIYQLIVKKITNKNQRMIVGALLFLALALVYIEIAVGIFGTPFAGS